ncbi:MAG: hypothetical protein P4L73_10100, partial [Caulobacteraceae bacterium]|nr:hypothetical protein [Caulobacteraceae bacterium]
MFKVTLVIAGLGALALGAGSAHAATSPIDPAKVQSLSMALETALSGQGCGATSAQDEATIESTIASSGASPSEAEAALEVVQTSP